MKWNMPIITVKFSGKKDHIGLSEMHVICVYISISCSGVRRKKFRGGSRFWPAS